METGSHRRHVISSGLTVPVPVPEAIGSFPSGCPQPQSGAALFLFIFSGTATAGVTYGFSFICVGKPYEYQLMRLIVYFVLLKVCVKN